MADGAPADLESLADATHALDDSSVFSLLVTYGGSCVGHMLKNINMHIASSHEAEAYATGKAGEVVDLGRDVLRAWGQLPDGPTFVGTDNKANALVGSGRATPSRLRHCLRRYRTFTERRERGEVELGFVPDVENPSDFLTKWVSASKLEASLEYCCNSRNAVQHTRLRLDGGA
jgi:hypothetical protein